MVAAQCTTFGTTTFQDKCWRKNPCKCFIFSHFEHLWRSWDHVWSLHLESWVSERLVCLQTCSILKFIGWESDGKMAKAEKFPSRQWQSHKVLLRQIPLWVEMWHLLVSTMRSLIWCMVSKLSKTAFGVLRKSAKYRLFGCCHHDSEFMRRSCAGTHHATNKQRHQLVTSIFTLFWSLLQFAATPEVSKSF